MSDRIYILLNDEDVPFGRGAVITPVDAPEILVKVIDGEIDEMKNHKLVTLVGTLQTLPTLHGEVLSTMRNTIKLRRVDSKEDVREVLRVDVCFDSLIYPVSGQWRGRRRVEFIDLSCGGIAFICDEPMERGELVEIVIPVTPQPLLMRGRILRSWERGSQRCYAARFVGMCHDEEKLICEAVFGIQLEQYGRKK